jgi:hypothetical protein
MSASRHIAASRNCEDNPAIVGQEPPFEDEPTFLVHGEEQAMEQLASLLKDTQAELPALHQVFEL